MAIKLILVKPPGATRFNFGAFSLGVLAASIRHLAQVSIIDTTGLTVEKAVETVESHNADMVGVTVMGLPSVIQSVEFIEKLKSAQHRPRGRRNRRTILAGGHGASMVPEMFLSAGVDAVVMGEGERTVERIFVNGIEPGAPGLACLVDGRMVKGRPQSLIRPLDQLPLPARDLMPPSGDGIHLMETSRGCPHSCAFCETTRFYGRNWRPYSPARVAAEVRRLVELHDAWTIHFADDNFAADPKRVLEISERIQENPMPALILASARADDLLTDARVIPAMARAHILRISVGVETVDLATAQAAGKPIPIKTYQEVFRRMREHGMFSVASFIIGLPGETRVSRERAAEMAIEAGPDSAHFLPFLPLPGVPMASHRKGLDPDPIDERDADLANRHFFKHPEVQKRLAGVATADGMRGLLARATLSRIKSDYSFEVPFISA